MPNSTPRRTQARASGTPQTGAIHSALKDAPGQVDPVRVREDRAIYRAIRILDKRLREQRAALGSPNAVRDFLRLNLAEAEREIFYVLFLDSQNQLIAAEPMFFGTLTQASVFPREVVKRALHHNAGAVIFAHNHPSGTLEPSRKDHELTFALKSALTLVDVKVLDHFIVGGKGIMSFAERNMI